MSDRIQTLRHRWRFAVVLLASLLLAVAQPLVAGLFGERGSFDVSRRTPAGPSKRVYEFDPLICSP